MRLSLRIQAIAAIFVSTFTFVNAEVKMPAIFADNMVLQADDFAYLYGTAAPGEKIKVTGSWTCNYVSGKADEDGNWEVKLPLPERPGPHLIGVDGKSNYLTFSNVMLGEVWVCSGQSNMEMGIAECTEAEKEIAAANFPNIRLFRVEKTAAIEAASEFAHPVKWEKCSPETVKNGGWGGYSALAYYFAKQLKTKMNRPIGIIQTAWGGSSAEAWTPLNKLKSLGYNKEIANYQNRFNNTKPNFRNKFPAALFNGMLSPLTGFNIKGVIWYQGEANTPRGEKYEELFRGMIDSWRNEWNLDFPFYYVQIAPFVWKDAKRSCVEVMEAQRRTLTHGGTGMVVISDIGNLRDIHPKNKIDIGRRMGNLVLDKTYGFRMGQVYGPLYKSFKQENGKIRVFFDEVGESLVAKGELKQFRLAGKDGVFKPAKAVIDGKTVLVSSVNVKNPVAVDYGWSNNHTAELFNKAGLPASVFSSSWNKPLIHTNEH